MSPRNREPLALLLVGTAVLIWSGLRPADRMVWGMEVIPSVVGVGALVLTYRRFSMTLLTYRLIFAFSLILFVGGKYTYAEVPLGFWVKDLFHLQRNSFDRLGHFFQGVVPAILTREMLIRCTPLRPGKALFWICCSVAVAVSAGYALIEWQSAIWTAPEQGTAFLGTQGDVWDAQKDMLMAFLGSLTVQLAFARVHDRQLAALPSAAPCSSPP
jgi:putative membrane protein